MRSSRLNLLAAFLLASGAFAGVGVDAMDGYGSPWDYQTCDPATGCTPVAQTGLPAGSPVGAGGGHPQALIRPYGYNGPTTGAVQPCVPTAPAQPSSTNGCTATSCVPANATCPGPYYSIYYGGGTGAMYGGSPLAAVANWPPKPPPGTPPGSAYWDKDKMCMLSPQCIPYPNNMGSLAPANVHSPSFRLSNPFFGMGMPVQPDIRGDVENNMKYRTLNPCVPLGADPYFDAIGQQNNSPFTALWNKVESVENQHVHDGTRWAEPYSISQTPFRPGDAPPPGSMPPPPPPPPGGVLGSNTDPYSPNPFNEPYTFGRGRFHTDANHILRGVQQTLGAEPGNVTSFQATGDPDYATGKADNGFVVLNNDGYLLGRFQTPVEDQPGFDFSVNTFHETGERLYTTMCVLGATNPQGPFTLVHSSFVNTSTCDTTLQTTAYCPLRHMTPSADCLKYPVSSDECRMQVNPCPQPTNVTGIFEYCWMFDLRFFYTQLRKACGLPCTGGQPAGRMTYFLILSSSQQTPYLKTDFDIGPVFNSPGCIDQTKAYYGLRENDPARPGCPTVSFYPFPLRHITSAQESQEGMTFSFKDTSVRFGYPLWQAGNPLRHEITDTHADFIQAWNWDFSSDPYAVEFMWDSCADLFCPPCIPACWQRVPAPPFGQEDAFFPEPYMPPATGDPLPPEDLWPYNQRLSGPNGRLQEITDPLDHNRTHTYFAPGIFPACLSTHTNDQDVNSGSGLWKAHWRQSDPPFSDRPPIGDTEGIDSMRIGYPFVEIPHIRPRPDTTWPIHGDAGARWFRGGGMFCKPVTVFNAPPLPNTAWTQDNLDPLRFRFHSVGHDPDWQCPVTVDPNNAVRICEGNLTHPRPFWNSWGAPICGDCPPDGVMVRQWDFRNDGFVPHADPSVGYSGRCMPSLPWPNCSTYTTPQGDTSWRFLSRVIPDAFTWDPTFEDALPFDCSSGPPIRLWFCGWNTVCRTYPVPGQMCTGNDGRLPNACGHSVSPTCSRQLRPDLNATSNALGRACVCNFTRILHDERGSFRPEDVGAKVSGYGVLEGTFITEYLDTENVLVSQDLPPSYMSLGGCAPPGDPLEPCPPTRGLHAQVATATLTSDPFSMRLYPLRIAISWPYDPARDDPEHEYPIPSNYALKHTLCDHDYAVQRTPGLPMSSVPAQATGTVALGNFGGMGRVVGDPMDLVEVPLSGASAVRPPWAPPTGGAPKTIDLWATETWPGASTAVRSRHACASEVKTLTLPNHAPHIAVPSHFALRPGGYARFTARAWDVDAGQVLTLRLCPTDPLASTRTVGDASLATGSRTLRSVSAAFTPLDVGRAVVGPGIPAGTHIRSVRSPTEADLSAAASQSGTNVAVTITSNQFPTASTPGPGKSLEQVFHWDMSGLPVGAYGPVCFEVTDGIATTRMLTTIYVASERTDTDGDGVGDLADNCPGRPNPDQADANLDGAGDACQDLAVAFDATPAGPEQLGPGESDVDLDGVADVKDNCVDRANRDQSDDDGDQLGDLCDPDADGDAVPNLDDNCPFWPNPRQEDHNADGLGDICIGPSPLEPGASPSAVGQGDPVRPQDGTWGMVLGSLLGLVVMVGVSVPLLLFALRRHQERREDKK